MELYRNEHFVLTAEEERIFISVHAPHYPLKEFDSVAKQIPRLQLTNFAALRAAIAQADKSSHQIGTLRGLADVSVSKDFMEATAKVYATNEQWPEVKSEAMSVIMHQLGRLGVTEGILFDVIGGNMPLGQDVVVARGISPVDGEDAVVVLFELSERKPSIRQDGSTDYYEMSFIDEVKPGDWLGEKKAATEGTPGRNLRGIPIPAQKGKDKRLAFDRRVVGEYEENGVIVLRSLVAGCVQKVGGKISVLEMLFISGDVGAKTGNIDFDGSVQITGTIQDGYSVTATKDISILGEMGIGAAGSIISKTGDIFIKGGIFGKNRATVQAERNVFVKHAQECTIHAAENIHIGLYAIGCNLQAKYIFLDKRRGKVIGGHVQAKVQMVTAFIGNESERPTTVQVEGFNRSHIMKELEHVLSEYKRVLAELEKLRKEVDLYEQYVEMLKGDEENEYWQYMTLQEAALEKVTELEERRKKLVAYLGTKGEGEVTIIQKAFPRTVLQIKEIEKRIEQIMTGSFYVSDNKLFYE